MANSLTLADALATGRLIDFIAQAEAEGIGPADRGQFSRAAYRTQTVECSGVIIFGIPKENDMSHAKIIDPLNKLKSPSREMLEYVLDVMPSDYEMARHDWSAIERMLQRIHEYLLDTDTR